MGALLNNIYVVGFVMAAIIFFATQVIKLPIKHFTSKIKNERARRMTNTIILFIPFALGILCDFLYSTYVLHTAFSIIVGLGYGSAGISLYGTIERFFKVKIKNPYETDDGKAVVELVDSVVEDKKIEKKDKDLVKEFLKKVK